MRLWPQQLLSVLPEKQLASQHRECCALRGMGWGKKHSTVDYVFTHPIEMLVNYHILVMNELRSRSGWNMDLQWYDSQYRGKRLGIDESISSLILVTTQVIYPEHNQDYINDCVDNLIEKLKAKPKSSKIDQEILALSMYKS